MILNPPGEWLGKVNDVLLHKTGRIWNLGGGTLSFNRLLEELYYLRRHRECCENDRRVSVIQGNTDVKTKELFRSFFYKYIDEKYGPSCGWTYTAETFVDFFECDLPEVGVTLRLLVYPAAPVGRIGFYDETEIAKGCVIHPENHLVLLNIGGFVE